MKAGDKVRFSLAGKRAYCQASRYYGWFAEHLRTYISSVGVAEEVSGIIRVRWQDGSACAFIYPVEYFEPIE